ncbi:MAG: HDOD domain-containing protein [Chloroflexota bacterium]
MPSVSETQFTARELILATCEIPAVPVVALKVLRVIEDPYALVSDIQRVIVADEALASRILRIANAAFYGRRQKIDTISEAITVLGLHAIKVITLAVSTREVYKRLGLTEQKLWEHSLGVSLASGIIGGRLSLVKAEEATVAGLVHDIGKAIMNNSQPDRFSILTKTVWEQRVQFLSLEQDFFGFTHAEAGALFAEKWGFPKCLREAIRRHHLVSSSECSEGWDAEERTLCEVVALADAICVRLGIGYRGPMGHLDLGEERLMTVLGLTSERLDVLESLFKDAYVRERTFYMEQ